MQGRGISSKISYEKSMSLISTDFAEKNLKEFKIIDASWHLPTENRDPYLEYKESHIPNSVFFDLDNTSEKNTDLPHICLLYTSPSPRD